ncbi:hypothetical protein SS50377_23155 [Spironucleus salmonicida]|uniref:Uncharacterized protein n=1 Tax=Spironucleus salmonicida TaxID=348837 RepID=A0A9P8LWF4_9EUKA|nr:hypothetical protein SS50377_23155 [Spironucleus salmonicida]
MPRKTILMASSARATIKSDVLQQLQTSSAMSPRAMGSPQHNLPPTPPGFLAKHPSFNLPIPVVSFSPKKILSARELMAPTSEEVSDQQEAEAKSKLYQLERSNDLRQMQIDNLAIKNQQLTQRLQALERQSSERAPQVDKDVRLDEIVEQNIRMESELAILREQVQHQKPQIIEHVKYITENSNFKALYEHATSQLAHKDQLLTDYKIEIQALKELFGISGLSSSASPKERAMAMMTYKGIKSDLVDILQREVADLKAQLKEVSSQSGSGLYQARIDLFAAREEIKQLSSDLDAANGAFDEYLKMDMRPSLK